MNVKANKVLSELKFVDSLNVPPRVMKAMYWCYLIENWKHPIKNIYLGNSIQQITYEKIQKIFRNKKFIIQKKLIINILLIYLTIMK